MIQLLSIFGGEEKLKNYIQRASEEELDNVKEYVNYLMNCTDLFVNIILKLKNLLHDTSKMHS